MDVKFFLDNNYLLVNILYFKVLGGFGGLFVDKW